MELVSRSFDGSGGLLLFGLRGKASPVPRRVPCSVQAFFGGAPGVLTRRALPCCSCVSFLAVARALGWGGVEVSRQVGPRLHRGPGSGLFGKRRVFVCLTSLLRSAALRPLAPAPACALGLLSQVRGDCFVGDVVSAFLESWNPDVVLLVDTVCSRLYPISGSSALFIYFYRVYDTTNMFVSRVLLCEDSSDIHIVRIESSNKKMCSPVLVMNDHCMLV